MSSPTPTTAMISIIASDKVGLIAAISGRLFDLGANLSDTTFSILGGGAEFSAVCEFQDAIDLATIESELADLDELNGAEIIVSQFEDTHAPDSSGITSHRITISGGDRPGLVARLCEVFIQFQANIIRLNAEHIPGSGDGQYVIRISVAIPDSKAPTCLATVANTAGEMGLNFSVEEA